MFHGTENCTWIFTIICYLSKIGYKVLNFKIYFCHSVVAFTMVLLTAELDMGTLIMALYADQFKQCNLN